jgi:nitroreductase
MLVMTDGPRAGEAKRLIAESARQVWGEKRQTDGYDSGSGVGSNSAKSRMARAMQHYVDDFENAPVLILACLVRYRKQGSFEGASVFPACQNILLAARALGYGGVLTGFHFGVEAELRALLAVPEDVFMAATITLGRPKGGHGPVRRRPMAELVFDDAWDNPAPWAVDPPGTRHTSAGPPPRRQSEGTPAATAGDGRGVDGPES